jgi:glycosyltransferase involved in cell wall biosynthesis
VKRRLLVVSNDHVGSRMAGPGIRSFNFARELVAAFEVTLSAPNTVDLEIEGVRIKQLDPRDASTMTMEALRYDAVLAQRLPIPTMLQLAQSSVRTVYDLYDPALLELVAHSAKRRESANSELSPTRLVAYERLIQAVVLATGDAFICANERQRDLWLGWLAACGRIDLELYSRDQTFRSLIDVVPFGLDASPPASGEGAIKGVLPGIPRDAQVLIWAGGIWDWLDPATVIRAVAELGKQRSTVRLVFMGGGHPNPIVGAMSTPETARRLASDLGVLDRLVVFNKNWVPYQERGRWLTDADIGVSAHFDDAEARFAARTRHMDYLWAGLPIVTTGGDGLSDLVQARRLGRVVAPGDVRGWTEALTSLLNDEADEPALSARIEEARSELVWPRVVQPLARLLSVPGNSRRVTFAVRTATVREVALRSGLSLDHRGVAGIPRHALTHITRLAARSVQPRLAGLARLRRD